LQNNRQTVEKKVEYEYKLVGLLCVFKVKREKGYSESGPKQDKEQKGGLIAEAFVLVVPYEHELDVGEDE
jgi:hypothetical protein